MKFKLLLLSLVVISLFLVSCSHFSIDSNSDRFAQPGSPCYNLSKFNCTVNPLCEHVLDYCPPPLECVKYVGCQEVDFSQVKQFKIDLYSVYSSSSGDRILDVYYNVRNGTLVSCSGTYTLAMSDGTTVSECDIEKLKNGEYAVKYDLIMNLTEANLVGGYQEGPFNYTYSWVYI